MVNPARAYTRAMRWIRLPSLEAVRLGACSMVIKFIFQETDTRNGTELTKIISAAKVIRLLTSMIGLGIST